MNFEEQIMSRARSFENWEISRGYSPVLAGGQSVRDGFRQIARKRKCLMDYTSKTIYVYSCFDKGCPTKA